MKQDIRYLAAKFGKEYALHMSSRTVLSKMSARKCLSWYVKTYCI